MLIVFKYKCKKLDVVECKLCYRYESWLGIHAQRYIFSYVVAGINKIKYREPVVTIGNRMVGQYQLPGKMDSKCIRESALFFVCCIFAVMEIGTFTGVTENGCMPTMIPCFFKNIRKYYTSGITMRYPPFTI